MGKINMGRVILGGLLAGLVIDIGETVLNAVILGKDWEAAMQALNRPTMGGGAIALFMILGFALGIAMVWTYAAIRPRFGPGPKTAICAGLLVWFFSYFYPSVGLSAMDIFPTKLIVVGVVWGIFETAIASVAGAWAYKEA